VREWAIANGGNPKLRIALCGYEGEHDMPKSWECVEWKAAGGYAAPPATTRTRTVSASGSRPHCELVERQRDLFEEPTGRVVA
jgi:DNA adenine methylase